MTYLDYNSTAHVRPEAIDAVTEALISQGNASSVHALGRQARTRIEAARAKVAALAGCLPSSVTFLSGGVEANALAIESAVLAGFGRLIISATEHVSVLETARLSGVPVMMWPVDGDGLADLTWLENTLAQGPRALVCLMLANNETGVIQPVAKVSALVRAAEGWLHVDAVQAAGKITIGFSALGADTLSLSAHKIGGPQGVGALVAGPRATLTRRIHGGAQEGGRRSGTENGPGIAGFGAAADAALRDLTKVQAQSVWRDAFAVRAVTIGAVILGGDAPRLAQTLCLALPGYSADVQVMAMDLAQIMVSAGSACSSGKVKPSHVVEAMGHSNIALNSIRISGGWDTTEEDWHRAADVWLGLAARHLTRQTQAA